ncbi:hypothetical protein [Pontivivens nitratireducens]|uniref:Uncharacterized protein n=1 Tax=Pontivivens nitratireducens TaxID=2758038 RepID=A0A6G7VHJ6_9RHOB|nr:hypothetical protein [Pontibrevibacter nitratireducens]QIK39464.1 hypothetical protein G8E03_01035 [Pontibrevibacter nitratireducens]
MSRENLSFAIFLTVFCAGIGGIVWWNVQRISQNTRLPAEAAPRMSCRFTQWCVAQDCTVQPLVDFVLITRSRFDRAYLRMNQRGGGLSVFVGGNAYFARHDADADTPDLAPANSRGRGICDWIVEETA